MPELAGTLPDLGVNAIPPSDSLTTAMGGLDLLGVNLGLSESWDVGLNFSRGLHSVIRLDRDGAWAVSISPAIYRYSYDVSSSEGARVTNLNLTGLASLDPWPAGSFLSDGYVGAGVSRYSATLSSGGGEVSHSAVVPTVLSGIRFGGPRCFPFCRAGDPRTFTFGAEAQGSWIRQRNGRRDFVPTVRIFLSLGLRVPERPPPGRGPPRPPE